jgi:hypothetical protein
MERWVELATHWCGQDGVAPGTMMGFPCVRYQGGFMACMDKDGTHLILKLSATRVSELVGEGLGENFSPAGRVFKEWLAIPVGLEHTFDDRMAEAYAFAQAKPR